MEIKNQFEGLINMEDGTGYFIGESGLYYSFKLISYVINTKYKYLRNKHILKQLNSLGLLTEFFNGITPVSLPYTFS